MFMFLDSRKYYNYGGHSVLEISHSEFAHGTDKSEWYKHVGSDQMHTIIGGGSGLGIIRGRTIFPSFSFSLLSLNYTVVNIQKGRAHECVPTLV